MQLVTTGYGWSVLREISERAGHIQGAGPAVTVDIDTGARNGPENILIMGLDSRRDRNGKPLPKAVLDQLHAGDSDNSRYNTNVLMLVHLPGDGGKPVGISVPRDD